MIQDSEYKQLVCNEIEIRKNAVINTLSVNNVIFNGFASGGPNVIVPGIFSSVDPGRGHFSFVSSAPVTMTVGGPWVTIPTIFTTLEPSGASQVSYTNNTTNLGYEVASLPLHTSDLLLIELSATVSTSAATTPFFEIGVSIDGADPVYRAMLVAPVIGVSSAFTAGTITLSVPTSTITLMARCTSTVSVGIPTVDITIDLGDVHTFLFGRSA